MKKQKKTSVANRCRTYLPWVLFFSALVVQGCLPIENCQVFPLNVSIQASPTEGPLPLEVHLAADGEGYSCGCCSGDSTHIVAYRWDTDGDGVDDLEGADLKEFDLTFDEPGEYVVRVTVVDSADDTSWSQVTIRVDAD